MKVLMVATRDPRGTGSGRRTVLMSTIDALVGLGHEVRVLALTTEPPAPGWRLPSGAVVTALAPPRPPRVLFNVLTGPLLRRRSFNESLLVSSQGRREVRAVADAWGADIVVADMIRTFELARAAGRPVVVDLDDLLSQRYEATTATSDPSTILGYYRSDVPAPLQGIAGRVAVALLRWESGLLARRERQVALSAAATVLVAPDEAALLGRRSCRRVHAIPMAVEVRPAPDRTGPVRVGRVVFVGGLEYQPNLDALDWYVAEVAPALVAAGGGDIALDVIGSCGDEARRRYEAAGLTLLGYVPDVGVELDRYAVFVAPIRTGTGIKTKVVEAMAYGCAVVATSAALRGIPAEDGVHCLVADDAGSFARAMVRLRDDAELAGRLASAARLLAETHFSRDVVRRSWGAVLDQAATRPLRALFLNDYPMDRAVEQWAAGTYPGQHLFGVSHLPTFDIDVDVLPFGRLTRWRVWVAGKVGDVTQQARVLVWRRPYDVLYAGSQYDTAALSVLRRLGLYRRPIVATMHHLAKGPLRSPLVFRALYGGHDLLLCMSEDIRREIVDDFGFPTDRVEVAGWAVDLDFYDSPPVDVTADPLFVAAGKTKRDYDTFVEAASGMPYPVEVYCSADSAPTVALGDNVSVRFDPRHTSLTSALSLDQLLERYRASRAIAIPLPASEVRGTTGLTSLLEGMAMRRAVVMTDNSFLRLEAEGAGIVVEPGEVAGWRSAMDRLASDPELAARLGERGRQICEERFSLPRYAGQVADGLRRVTGST